MMKQCVLNLVIHLYKDVVVLSCNKVYDRWRVPSLKSEDRHVDAKTSPSLDPRLRPVLGGGEGARKVSTPNQRLLVRTARAWSELRARWVSLPLVFL